MKSFHLHFRGVKSTPVVPRYCYICNYLVSVGLFVPVDLFLLITSLKHVQNDPERYRCNAVAVGQRFDQLNIFGEITWFQYELGVITFRPTPRSGSGWNLPSHVGGIKSFHLHFRGVKSTPVVPRYCYICNYLVSVGLFVPVDLFLLITSLKHVQNDPERYCCNADAVGQRFDQFLFLVKLLDFSMNSA